MDLIENILKLLRRIAHSLWFSGQGHLSHLIVGIIIGGFVSILIYKNSGNKVKAVIIGLTIASVIGLLKEVLDPYVGRNRDLSDFYYTCLGGVLGCLAIFSKRLLRFITPDS